MESNLFFDYCLNSDIEFPELLPCEGERPLISVRRDPGLKISKHHRLCHNFVEDGEIQVSCYSSDDGYLLEVPDYLMARFDKSDMEISFLAKEHVTEETIRHLLLDQMLPRLVSQRFLILHGSAVTNGESTFLFVGRTGQGKSTLAAAFAAAGWSLLSDDCLKVAATPGFSIIGAYPGVRLSPGNVIESKMMTCAGEMAQYSEKLRYRCEGVSSTRGLPVDALFFLGEDAPIKFGQPGGSESSMALVAESFCVNPADLEAAGERMSTCARLVSSGVPAYRMDYPRQLDQLPTVLESINVVGGNQPSKPGIQSV